MSTKADEPRLDSVEMVRKIRDAHQERLKNASPEERIAFYRQRAALLHSELGLPEESPRNPRPDRAEIQRRR